MRIIACLIAAGMIVAPTAALAKGPSVARGLTYAKRDCAACHQVTPKQVPPEPVTDPDSGDKIQPPSFMAISAKYRGNDKALRAFIHNPKYPMKEQDFLGPTLDDIVAYIRSLSRKP